ncbi:8783_t:CDS:1, partial [Dentiscutata erythropus]
DEPEVERYIATILNPRFKDLSFEPKKLKLIKKELKYRIEIAKNKYLTASAKNNQSFSLLNLLFEKSSQE